MTETQIWIEKILQQLAAESYLDNLPDMSDIDQYKDSVIDRLTLGANNYRIDADDPDIRGILEDPTEGDAGKQHATRMLKPQAEMFVENFEILHHLPNRSTGFSATLTRNKSTGEITLSFRSTEFREEKYGGDTRRDGILGADGDIFFDGYTLGQLMSMEQYYDWLVTESGLVTEETRLDVTGYSLGGQLATVFTMLHEDVVNKAYTFNGVGLGSNFADPEKAAQIIEDYRAAVTEYAQQQGETLPADFENITADIQLVPKELNDYALYETTDLPSLYKTDSHAWAESQVNHLYGADGANPFETDTSISLSDNLSEKIHQIYGHADHNDMELVANQGINSSQEISVFIEDQPDWILDGDFAGLGGDFGDTHSIILILDSLLLTETLQFIDPSLDRLTLEQVYSASHVEVVNNYSVSTDPVVQSNSLEATLDRVGKALMGEAYIDANAGDHADAFGMLEYRNSFYNNLESLKTYTESLRAQGREISIKSLVNFDIDEVVELASAPGQGLSYRYALHNLNPLAVIIDEDAFPPGQGFESYSLYDPETATGNMTESYLRDRAEMLFEQNRVRLGDLNLGEVHGFDDRIYTNGSESLLQVTTDNIYNPQKIIFDDDVSMRLEGSQWNDRIYAAFNEEDDQLQGNEGDDYLEGGLGNDTYVYNDGDGFDTILDADGLGSILYRGRTLEGGMQVADGIYQSGDGQVSYVLEQAADGKQNLLINNDIRILNFDSDHNLNIHLAEPVPHDPAYYASTRGSDENDFLQQTESAVYLDGGAGHDFLSAGSGNDVLIAGTGDDWLDGATGDDYLNGGAGNDLLTTGYGSNRADGNDGNDLILADRYLTRLSDDDALVKRIWLDLGGKWITSVSTDTLLVDEAGNMGLHMEIGLPEQAFEGGSHDGTLEYQYDPQTRLLTYTNLLGETEQEIELLAEFRSFMNTQTQALSGGPGDDLLVGNFGDDSLHGGSGNDRLQGRVGNDVLAGEQGNDWLLANQGDDYLSGGDGSDWLFGGAGKDRLHGGSGNDYLIGDNVYLVQDQQQADRLFGGDGDDILMGNGGTDTLSGGIGKDTLYGGENADQLHGNQGDDRLYGENGDDFLAGGSGNDLLYGEEGLDWIEGGGGNDSLYGGDSNDALNGGSGDDVLNGGDGRDSYYFNLGDGYDEIHESATGNRLHFGHGISRDSIQANRDSQQPQDLLISYGAGDLIRISNYSLDLFTDYTLADYPEKQAPFSELLTRQHALSAEPETSLYFLNDNIAGATAADLEQTLSGNTEPDAGLNVDQIRQDYFRQVQEARHSSLISEGYVQIEPGLYEQAPTGNDNHRTYTRSDSKTYHHEMHSYYYQRWAVPDVTTTQLDSWTVNDSATRLESYEVAMSEDMALLQASPDDIDASGFMIPTRTEYREVSSNRIIYYRSLLNTVNQVVITGTDASDTIDLGSTRNNVVQAGPGDDVIHGDTGWTERTYAAPGNYLEGGAGDDELQGGAWQDSLLGGTGDDQLAGGSADDSYYMGLINGHDLVYDNGQLEAGKNDNDRIVMPAGIVLSDLEFEWSSRLYDAPIAALDSTLAPLPDLHSTLTLKWSENDSVTIVLPHSDVNAGYGIDIVEFADGSTYSMQQIIEVTGGIANVDIHNQDNCLSADISFSGGAGNDQLTISMPERAVLPSGPLMTSGLEQYIDPAHYPFLAGGAGRDLLQGSSARDWLIGGELHRRDNESSYTYWGDLDDVGNTFIGGKNDDVIWATAGDDRFEYAPGDGHDVITDALHGDESFARHGFEAPVTEQARADYLHGSDTLSFAEGIAVDQVTVSREDDDLVFRVNEESGSIRFFNWYGAQQNQLVAVEFASGHRWGADELDRLSRGLPLNSAPGVKVPVENQVFDNNRPIDFQFSEHAFIDADNDTMTYSLALASGDELPGWLQFDAETLTLTSVGHELPAGEYELSLVATDVHGESALQQFSITVEEKYNRVSIESLLPYGLGTSVDDHLGGDQRANLLFAGDGDDLLRGNGGDDRLHGGRGDDIYLYSKGDGHDMIFDKQGYDVLALQNIAVDDVYFSRSVWSLDIGFADTEDSIGIFQLFNSREATIDRIEFDDGTAIVNQQLESLISAMAGFNAPVAASSLIAANEAIDNASFAQLANAV